MTVFEEVKELVDVPQPVTTAWRCIALHHAGYAEHIANAFMLADKEERLFMKEDIERIE